MRGKSLRTTHAAAGTRVPNQVCGIGGNGDKAIAVFDFLKSGKTEEECGAARYIRATVI